MKTIWKYRMPLVFGEVEMPMGAKVLCVQVQHEVPCLWVEVEPQAPTVKRKFGVVGTGHTLPDIAGHELIYLGTFQLDGGDLIFHAYEVRMIGE